MTYNHLGRTANAGLRPRLYRHEIELPGSRANPGCEVIPLRELTVRWASAAERFVLRWARGGVELTPVLSSGVSPEGFVQFLVEIGRQGLQPLGCSSRWTPPQAQCPPVVRLCVAIARVWRIALHLRAE